MGELEDRTAIREFDISQRTTDILEEILSLNPRIVGLGVYIWNAQQSEDLAAQLKRLRPGVLLIIGGPEVSYEIDRQPICALADYVIAGEADLAFAELVAQLLAGHRPLLRVIQSRLPEMNELGLPYSQYTDADIAHRVLYVEASRGCPFKCEFCLSSLDVPVRYVPTDLFLREIGFLLNRGARHLKFVDRTFNLNLTVSRQILEFLLEQWEPGRFFHFEMIPDRLPEPLRDVIAQFPSGSLQFEVGIQTFNSEVSDRISRRQDNRKVEENLRFLRQHTGVHIHADLIVGLPGEGIDSFAAGFDRLVSLDPQEIQVGMLKRLRGTPIVRHDESCGMKYSLYPPYEILETGAIQFTDMQRMRRFARHWDIIANSGNFLDSTPLLWADQGASPFHEFLALSEWLHKRESKGHGIALTRLVELLFEYLTRQTSDSDRRRIAQIMLIDYQRCGRSDVPKCLRPFVDTLHRPPTPPRSLNTGIPARQNRHNRQHQADHNRAYSPPVDHAPETAGQ